MEKRPFCVYVYVCERKRERIWHELGNWMVQDGMLHCANSMVHSKALDEQYNR